MSRAGNRYLSSDGSEPASDPTRQGTSPYASGGGGVTLERRVAALYLTRLLTGATSAELEERRVTRVAFQSAKPVDDLVICAARDGETEPTLELAVAVRRAPDFVTSDTDTETLLTKFLRALRDAGQADAGVDQFLAICVAGSQTASQETGKLANLAKDHHADSFFELVRTPGRIRRKVVNRLDHLVALVKAGLIALGEGPSVGEAEHATWELLSRLRILMPRVESPDESDWADLLNQLQPWSRHQTLAAAAALRDRLESLAARYAPDAAVVELPKLRRDVHDVLNSDRRRNDRGWSELIRLDQDAREAVRTEMGLGPSPAGLHLPRTAAATTLRNRIGEIPCVMVYGESGVGKSALVLSELSAEVEADSDKLQVVFLNLRLLPRAISELRTAIGCAVEDILCEMSAPVRLLVIDAAEYEAESSPDLLRYLVCAAKASGVIVWVITTTEGQTTVRAVVETILSPIVEHEISPLVDEDLREVAAAFPQLYSLVADLRSKELLRRPVVADLLVRAGISLHPLSDADALAIVWEKLVRAGGQTDRGRPDSRDQILRRLAKHQLHPGTAADLYDSLDPAALDGLRRDGLLRPPSAAPWQVLPEFSHELLRTFAVSQVLLADGEPVTALLEADAPRWALPAARLAAQVLLAAPETAQTPMAGRLETIQKDFDRLAVAGHGQRWSDLSTEAVLPLPQAGTALGNAWTKMLECEALGLRRVLRVIRQRNRRQGFAAALIAEPVVELLLTRGWGRNLDEEVEAFFHVWLGALIGANAPAGHVLRLKLRRQIVQSVQEGDRRLAEHEAEWAAKQAARTPEQIREDEKRQKELRWLSTPLAGASRRQRWVELPTELISRSTLEKLSLLGPDLGEEGEALLRRVATDAPYRLAPAVDEFLAGRAIASYRPSLLTQLAEAYYLDDGEDGYVAQLEDGIRDHRSRFSPPGAPLAAYYRGPFLAMFQKDFRNGVACLNRFLNHAAKLRATVLKPTSWGVRDVLDDQMYRTVLSITGEPRTYIGDSHVWRWYRGTGVGPYPCMSALQALEVVCDQSIAVGTSPAQLATVLLEDCENLAMPGLVVGLLVRHLDKTGDALDPFFIEPVIWRLEFERVVNEHSFLAANSGRIHAPERREWSLRQAAMALAMAAEGERIDSLRELGRILITRARELENDDSKSKTDEKESSSLSEELAAVHGWAAALDRNSYHITEHEDGFLIQQTIDKNVQQVLEPGNQDFTRGNQAAELLFRYAGRRDNLAGMSAMSLAELRSDLATAQDLLADPPTASLDGPLTTPAAVAAGALQLCFIAGEPVAGGDLAWSAQVLLLVAKLYADREEPESSLYGLGADRSAACGIPFLFLPEASEIRAELAASGITSIDLTDAARRLTFGSPNEVRLLYAQSIDLTWRARCDDENPVKCHHGRTIELVEDSVRDCIIGNWEPETGQCTAERLDGPLEKVLASISADRINVRRLSSAIRSLAMAANTRNCCATRAEVLLAALLAAHRRGMAACENGYDHSRSDTLVAARALLVEVANGKEDLLQAHVEEYVDDSRLLAELLRALAAAAEENHTAAQAARSVWPKLIDQVLDLIDAGHRPRGRHYSTSSGLAALMPNRAYESGYLWRELEGEPIDWADVLAWRSQVERWLPIAVGSHECVDSLVGLLDSLTEGDQAASGLPWVEILVEARPDEIASRSWLLPDWLRELRPHLRNSEQLSCWQRIVDMLVVAGDTRVASLSD